jgi:hypothetical protein
MVANSQWSDDDARRDYVETDIWDLDRARSAISAFMAF